MCSLLVPNFRCMCIDSIIPIECVYVLCVFSFYIYTYIYIYMYINMYADDVRRLRTDCFFSRRMAHTR